MEENNLDTYLTMGESDVKSEGMGGYKSITYLIDFDRLMSIDEEKRSVILEMMKFNDYQYKEMVQETLKSMGIIVDSRTYTIEKIIKE